MPGRMRMGWRFALVAASVGAFACSDRVVSVRCPSGTTSIPDGCTPSCNHDQDCLSSEICDPSSQVCTPGVGPVPVIRFFAPTRSAVEAEESVKLVYYVEDALDVRLSPTSSSTPPLPPHGEFQTLELSQTSTFTLFAVGHGGWAERTVEVQVGPQAHAIPAIASFTASPNPVAPNGTVTVSWAVTAASSVAIYAEGEVFHRDSRSQGSVQLNVPADTMLTLTASSAWGASTTAIDVQLQSTSGVGVDAFTTSEQAVIPGANVMLSWLTHGASWLKITDAAGIAVFQTGDPASLAAGATLVSVPYPELPASGEVTYTLQTGSATSTSAPTTLRILVAEAPRVSYFSADPSNFVFSGSPTPIALTWEAHGANQVLLEGNGAELEMPMPGVLIGSAQLSVEASTTFELVAEGAVGSSSKQLQLWQIIPKSDAAQTPATAMLLSSSAVADQCEDQTGGKDAWFQLDVRGPGHAFAHLYDAGGHCGLPQGTSIELYRGTAKLGSVAAAIAGQCPSIEPRSTSFAQGLRPELGPYYLHVVEPAMTACVGYVMTAGIVPAGCGNQILDRDEECDDGNRINGDGCDGGCRFEPGSAYEVRTEPSTYQPIGGRELVLSAIEPDYPATDEGYAALSLPFEFTYFGRRYANLTVFVNGYLQFGGVHQLSIAADRPQPLPAGSEGPLVAVLWTDLVVDGGSSGQPARIAYAVVGEAPRRQLVIDYQNLRTYESTSTDFVRVSAQVVLDEATNSIALRYAPPLRMGSKNARFQAGVQNHQGLFALTPPDCVLGCSLDDGSFPGGQTVTFQPRVAASGSSP